MPSRTSSSKPLRELEQEARFFALSVDLFAVVDLQGILHRVNASVTRVLGYEPEEVVGRPVFDFVVTEDHAALRARIQASATGEETVNFQCRCIHRDGTERWLACSCPPAVSGENELLIVCRDVTSQKQLQLDLTEWKNRYDAAAQATGNVVYEWDTETDHVAWGGNIERLLGYSAEEMGNGQEAWLQLIHPDDRYDAARVFEDVLADKEAVHLEYRVRRKDGTYIHVQDDAQFFRDALGRTAKMIGCLKDITAAKSAEERFRRLVESAPTGILLVDAEGRIAFANPQVESQFGYTADEVLGEEVELLIPERYHEGHRKQRRSYIDTPAPRPVGLGLPIWGRRRDGSEFPVDVALTPLTVQDRPMVACTVVDLTERLDARRAIAESDRRLRQILDNTSAVIYVKEPTGRYLLINRQFEEIFHVTRAQLIGKTDFDLFPREMAEAFRSNDRRVAETGEVLKVEEVAPHDDGPHTYISVKFPLRDEDANIYAIAGISTDITDRVRAEQELQQVQQRMELILNSIGDGIFGLDQEGKMTFLNPAAQEMLGWLADDVIGEPHAFKVSQTQLDGTPIDETENPIQNTLRSGTMQQADDKMFVRRDGTRFPVEYRSTPLEHQRNLVGAVVTFRDTTERRRRRQTEQELQAARRVQQHLYPKTAPELPGFDLAGAVFPASEACGDYFDFVPLSQDRLALVVGDVAGHGLGPALQMVQTRAYLRAMLMGGMPPAEAIRKLNLLLIDDTPHEAFVTLFLAVLDARQRSFVYVGAGHEARVLRASGVTEELASSGLVLGVLPDAPLQRVGPKSLSAGDVLLILTDGVLEAYSPERGLFGWERTLDVVYRNRHRPAAEIVEALHAATREFAAGYHQPDDVTILLAKTL